MTHDLPSPDRPLNIGTRGSPLALAQAHETRARLAAAFALPRPLLGRAGCDFSFSGLKTAVAHAVGVTPQAVSDILRRDKRMPAEWCLKLERATGGAVTAHDLRPDLYPRGPA